MKRLLIAALFAAGLAGCSSEDPGGPSNSGVELISQPGVPAGADTTAASVARVYRTSGATSSLGHPIEYRFDFDSEGMHDYTQWSDRDSALVTWVGAGSRLVKVQARCALHNDKVSQWSGGKTVRVNVVLGTEIVRVKSSYYVNGAPFTRDLDLTDGVPDTVPYGSWITVFYQALDTSFDPTRCFSDLNKCFKYQMRYDRDSDRNTGAFAQMPWRPVDPVDTNEFGTLDSMSMNVGSVEYTIFARATDISLAPPLADPDPPSLQIVGNFDPTLVDYYIENHDGTVIGDGDTIVWDWWAPADSGVQQTPEPRLTKRFYFLVKATGRDHPWEREGSGVKSWLFRYTRADDPDYEEPFGRSGRWIDGLAPDALCDTAAWVATYALSDTMGDEIFDNPPVWNDIVYDFVIRGRDLAEDTPFVQNMYFNDGVQLMNVYDAGPYGRWTPEGTLRFRLILRR